ncbi:MAG: ABC transporter C-terminal domain-containing protein [Lachnospiraceae bacterium]
MESRDQEIDDLMCRPEIGTDAAKCTSLSREKSEIAEKLEELYAIWEELAE